MDYSKPAAYLACPSSVSLHHRPSPGLASGERGGARRHGGATESATGNSRPAARDGRASLRLDQAMDEPGRLSYEGPRQGAGGPTPKLVRGSRGTTTTTT